MKKRAVFTVAVAGLSWSIAAICLAAPIARVHLFGTQTPGCTSEMADCAQEMLTGGSSAIVSGGVWNDGEGSGGVDFAKLTIDGDSQTLRADDVPAAVPEPASLVLLGTGLLGVARFRRRSLKREAP